MKLNHINLPVQDVAAAREFLVTHFDMVVIMELGKNFLSIIRDDGEMILNLSHFDKKAADEILYHKDFHVGFFVESDQEVDSHHARLVAAGLTIDPPQKLEGRYAYYVDAPGGFQVEVACLHM